MRETTKNPAHAKSKGKTRLERGNAARIVEKTVKAPKKTSDSNIDKFKNLLKKNIPEGKSQEEITASIVESALVAEFSENIKMRGYYDAMKQVITESLLKEKDLQKDIAAIIKNNSH